MLVNGGFEKRLKRWILGKNSKRAKIQLDPKQKVEGRLSLRVMKRGGMPIDIVRHNVENLPKGKQVEVSAMVRGKGVKNAWLKFFIWDTAGNTLHKEVDVANLRGTFDWKKVENTFVVPEGADSAAVQFWMVLGGTVWLDDVRVAPVDQ